MPYRGENSGAGKDVRGELDSQTQPKVCGGWGYLGSGLAGVEELEAKKLWTIMVGIPNKRLTPIVRDS